MAKGLADYGGEMFLGGLQMQRLPEVTGTPHLNELAPGWPGPIFHI
jgi:hypothetical protein